MLKMALFDCAINEKCCSVDRYFPSFLIPTPGDLTAQESSPPGISHPRQTKCFVRGQPGERGAGRRWN